MDILKIVPTIIFAIDCIVLSAIILLSGRKVGRTWNHQRYGRYLLGSEQRTFYGGGTCKGDPDLSNSVLSAGHAPEYGYF